MYTFVSAGPYAGVYAACCWKCFHPMNFFKDANILTKKIKMQHWSIDLKIS
jgi:hypothetical protein